MSGKGRPFRFLAAIGIGWIGIRVLLLWPQAGSLTDAIKSLVPMPPARSDVPAPPLSGPSPPARVRGAATQQASRGAPPKPLAPPLPATAIVARYAAPEPVPLSPAPLPLPPRTIPDRIAPLPDRWSASSWFVARAGSGTGTAPGGQLGGGQAGIRIAYLLVPSARIAAFARVTAPLAGKGREASIGVEWQPSEIPLRIVAEQRFGLDGTKGGSGLGLVAGIDTEVRGFRLEGYGQTGAILRDRTEPYADGAIRLTRKLTPNLSLGTGAWAGAQRDAQRLDIGPTATVSLGKVRVSLDWRQRIAGRARPGSGLALTLGGDF